QHEELRHDVIGGSVVHLHPEEDDSILEELGVWVLALEAVGGARLELGQHVAVGWALGDPAGCSESRLAGKRSVTVQCHPYCVWPARLPLLSGDGRSAAT